MANLLPPRRSGIVRYLLLAVLLIIVLYTFNHGYTDVDQPRSPFTTSPDRRPIQGKPDSSDFAGEPAVRPDFSVPDTPKKPDTKVDTYPVADTGKEAGKEASKWQSDSSSSKGKGTTADKGSSIKEEEKKPKQPPAQKPFEDTTSSSSGSKGSKEDASSPIASGPEEDHPINKLIYDAQLNFAEMLSKETKTIEQAAQAYRKRRGRHPPPGFDLWFEFAQNNSAVIVEDFFDQIYHDLEPFWGMDPAVLRKESWDYEMTIHIRDGVASSTSDWFWTTVWLDLIKTIEHLLPDMDMALNAMDEPRLVVPFEDIDRYMQKAAKTVKLPTAKDVIMEFQQLPRPGQGDKEVPTSPKEWEDTSKENPRSHASLVRV